MTDILLQGDVWRVVRDDDGAVRYEYLRQPEGLWCEEYAPPTLLAEIAARCAWGPVIKTDTRELLERRHEIDRDIGELFGWWDFQVRPGDTGPVLLARRPRSETAGEAGALEGSPRYSSSPTQLLASAADGGHFLALQGKVAHARLASGHAATVEIPSSWTTTLCIAYAFALAVREARES